MSAYCPECETDLDQATGICPACRWDPVVAASHDSASEPQREISLTEKYRGTGYDIPIDDASFRPGGISRGRSFVVVGLVAGVALYGVVMTMMMGAAF